MRSIFTSGSFLAEGLEESRSEAADDQQLILLDRSAFLFGFGNDARVKREHGCRRADITLQGFGHQGFDERTLLADPMLSTTLAHGDLLAQFGREIGREVEAALRTTLWIARFPRLEPGRLGRLA